MSNDWRGIDRDQVSEAYGTIITEEDMARIWPMIELAATLHNTKPPQILHAMKLRRELKEQEAEFTPPKLTVNENHTYPCWAYDELRRFLHDALVRELMVNKVTLRQTIYDQKGHSKIANIEYPVDEFVGKIMEILDEQCR